MRTRASPPLLSFSSSPPLISKDRKTLHDVFHRIFPLHIHRHIYIHIQPASHTNKHSQTGQTDRTDQEGRHNDSLPCLVLIACMMGLVWFPTHKYSTSWCKLASPHHTPDFIIIIIIITSTNISISEMGRQTASSAALHLA